MRRLSCRTIRKGRCYAGFNPAFRQHIALFEAVMQGQHSLPGFRNEDVMRHVFRGKESPGDAMRFSGRTTRLLKRLQAHGLIST